MTFHLEDYAASKTYHEEALEIDRQWGSRSAEVEDLSYDLWPFIKGTYASARAYHEQALALARQLM